jgi:hypothetical protein
MSKHHTGRCAVLILSAKVIAAVAAQAQQPAKIDQRALLQETRAAYYQPIDRGVQGFSCTVSFDWNDVLERASGRRIPPREPTLVALKNAMVTVTDDIVKGVTVKVDYPGGLASVSAPVASREKILKNLVTASLEGWNPFLSDRILPIEGTKYHFEAMPGGYRLTLDGGTFFSILDLDPKLQVTHGESHLNGTTTEFTPTFDPSSHGWLITSLKTVTTQSAAGSVAEGKAGSSSAGPANDGDRASFTFSYQFVGDMLVPKKVTVQYADGIETPYELRDCSLVKTGGPEPKPEIAKP